MTKWTPEQVEAWDAVMNNPYNRDLPHDQLCEAARRAAEEAKPRKSRKS